MEAIACAPVVFGVCASVPVACSKPWTQTLYAELEGSSVDDANSLPNSSLNGGAKLVYTGIVQSAFTGGTHPAQLSALMRFVDSCITLMRSMSAVELFVTAEIP